MLLRLGAAFATGIILGFEREGHGRAAGLRTLVLVCVTATVAGILSEHYFQGTAGDGPMPLNWRPDPARLGAGLLAGMGFLGAGAIVRQGSMIRGVTTAALLWFTTVLGICYGSGEFALGGIGTAIAALTLFVLPSIEDLVRNDWYATVRVHVRLDGVDTAELVRQVEQESIRVKSLAVVHDTAQQTRTLTLNLKFKRGHLIERPDRIVRQLAAAPGVLSVSWD